MTSLNSAAFVKNALAAAVDETLTSQDVNLTNCDREPIHIPDAIQPHGILLVIDAQDFTLVRVSQNIAEIIDRPIESVLAQPIDTILSAVGDETMSGYLSSTVVLTAPLQLQFRQDPLKRVFNTSIHYPDGSIVLELEPSDGDNELSFFQFYQTIKAPMEQLQQTQSIEQLAQVTVAEIKKLTGFDRVMVYQFHPDSSGSIVAETVADDAEPYLGLRYPATDIPQQARYLYTLNWIRAIPTIDYTPVPLVPQIDPGTERPLDLSQSVLRSVSPLHLEYLANMGVQASMSISLIRNRQLWGLIACHHNRPKYTLDG